MDNYRKLNQMTCNGSLQFLEKGYKDTTIHQIAHHAELSPGTLYLYFKDKNELFLLLTVKLLEEISGEIKKLNRVKNFSVEEKLVGLKEIFLGMYESDERILNIFNLRPAGDYNRLSSEMRDRIKKASFEVMKSIAAIFEQGMGGGWYGCSAIVSGDGVCLGDADRPIFVEEISSMFL